MLLQYAAMKRDLAGAHLGALDYERLRSACKIEGALPGSYEAWLALVGEGTELAVEAGYPSERIDIDVDEFLRWCMSADVHPCLDAMRAFIIVKRHGVGRALAGAHRDQGQRR